MTYVPESSFAKNYLNKKNIKFNMQKQNNKKFSNENKAQGAIEYLLIIGAAILVVALVIIAVTSVTTSGTANTSEESVDATLNPLEIQKLKMQGYEELSIPAAGKIFTAANDGEKYYLTQSQTSTAYTLRFNGATNMIIDCLGNTIETKHTAQQAVFINVSNGIILKNCNLKGIANGLYIYLSGKTTPITIDNVTINLTGTQTSGIRNYGSNTNFINVNACNAGNVGNDIRCDGTYTINGTNLQADKLRSNCDLATTNQYTSC
jgi:hypothetical protein